MATSSDDFKDDFAKVMMSGHGLAQGTPPVAVNSATICDAIAPTKTGPFAGKPGAFGLRRPMFVIMAVLILFSFKVAVVDVIWPKPSSSSGFSNLVPLMTDCRLTDLGLYGGNASGYYCLFRNEAGQDVWVKDFSFRLEGQSCNLNLAGNETGGFLRFCYNADCTDSFGGQGSLYVPKGSNFSVTARHQMTFLGAKDACSRVIPGQSYDADVAIAYVVGHTNASNQSVSAGRIVLSATPSGPITCSPKKDLTCPDDCSATSDIDCCARYGGYWACDSGGADCSCYFMPKQRY
jgi:hypothetical protein